MDGRTQLEKETAALKSAIYQLINAGNRDMASLVLERYGILNPADPEIVVIKNLLGGGEESKTKLNERFSIMDKIETVFILQGLYTLRTGVMASVLNKVKLMEERWGYHPLILVCDHLIGLRQTKIWLQTSGSVGSQAHVGANTRILGVYDYFQKSYAEGLTDKSVREKPKDGVPSADNQYEIYEDEILVKREHFTGPAGSLRMVEYFMAGKITKAVYYDDWGYLNSERAYGQSDDGVCEHELFYDTDGKICLKAFYSPKSGHNEPIKIEVFDGGGKIIKECADNAELAALCLEQIMGPDKFYMLTVENAAMAKAVTRLTGRNAARLMTVHSRFLEDSYDLKSKPQPNYKFLCENVKRFDGVIFPTETEKNDFDRKYGGKTFAVPHPYPKETVKRDFNLRNHKRAVIVARFDPVKRIDWAIEIFALVLKAVPDAKLDIYGFGTYEGAGEESYRRRIEALGIGESVSIKGFTDNPSEVFGGAALSMMTSSVEGYGLTLAESICNGCPAFAFDIKYGPGDIIDDGKTGFLVSRFDKNKYAGVMAEYLNDEKLQRRMSGECYAQADKFGAESFLEKWYKMTKTLYEIKCKI